MSDNFVEISFPFENDYNTETTVKITQKTEIKILKLMSANKYITTTEISEDISRSRSAIAKLKKEGIIERIGTDKGGYWKLLK